MLSRMAGWRVALGFLIAIPLLAGCGRGPRASGAMEQEVYVWQREWGTNVGASVQAHGEAFRGLTVLVGEVTWVGRRPQWARVQPEWDAVRKANRRVGIAMRIGSYSGPFGTADEACGFLRRAARESLAEARQAGLDVAEFQLDFDCAARRLDGYRVWVEGLRKEVAPVPLSITVLPSWLDERAFGALARAAGGFVLQVHSLARPRTADEGFRLCDPVAARRAVERATRAGGGTEFRVALPTYGYLVAFGTNATFLGASAEGPMPARPAGTVFRELRSDPVAMAQLVADWTGDRPAAMRGVIWYRLPVVGDRFNWRWSTLESVMAGVVPKARWTASARTPEPGLVEVSVMNEGTADRTGSASVRVKWEGVEKLGADGMGGFRVILESPTQVLFTNSICRLPAGEAARIGWVRLHAPAAVTLENFFPETEDSPTMAGR